MIDSQKIIDLLSTELVAAAEEMPKTEALEKKLQLSKLVKNLTDSLNVLSSMPCGGFQAIDISEEDAMEIDDLLDEQLG